MAKRIVLSGVTRGLGRALVPLFASAKHSVFGCGRTHAAIDELTKKFAAPHQFAALDVRDAAAVTAWAADILRTAGPPDLLIANAALMHSPAPLWTIPAAAFDDIVDVNIKGVANL